MSNPPNLKKKKFTVTGEVTVSVYTSVEAYSEEHAKEIAAQRHDAGHYVNSLAYYDGWVMDELDGDIQVKEAYEDKIE